METKSSGRFWYICGRCAVKKHSTYPNLSTNVRPICEAQRNLNLREHVSIVQLYLPEYLPLSSGCSLGVYVIFFVHSMKLRSHHQLNLNVKHSACSIENLMHLLLIISLLWTSWVFMICSHSSLTTVHGCLTLYQSTKQCTKQTCIIASTCNFFNFLFRPYLISIFITSVSRKFFPKTSQFNSCNAVSKF